VLLVTAPLAVHAAERPLARFVSAETMPAELAPLLQKVLDSVGPAETFDVEDDERLLQRARANTIEVLAAGLLRAAHRRRNRRRQQRALRAAPGLARARASEVQTTQRTDQADARACGKSSRRGHRAGNPFETLPVEPSRATRRGARARSRPRG
jgi:hypothetical protein